MVAQGNISSFYTFQSFVNQSHAAKRNENEENILQPNFTLRTKRIKQRNAELYHILLRVSWAVRRPIASHVSVHKTASLMDFSPRKKRNWLYVRSSTVSSYYFSVASFNHLFSMFFLAFPVSSLEWISRNLLLHFVLDYGLWSRWLMLVNSSFIFMNREAVEVYNHARKI